MKTFLCFLLLLVAVFTTQGKNIEKSSPSGPRIVGGTDAEDGFAPYQVSIQIVRLHFCGGSIISERYILTAAHCLYNRTQYKHAISVATGTNKWETPGANYNIENWILHRDYVDKEFHDDIAVIRLTQSIVWNNKTKPVALPTKQNLETGQALILTGWGLTHFPDNVIPKNLQRLSQRYISYEECYYNLNDLKESLTAGNVCAFAEDGKGGCKGDSGGPLVAENGELVGIVSWSKPCAVGDPDVYASTFYYKDWIKDAVKKLEKKSTN